MPRGNFRSLRAFMCEVFGHRLPKRRRPFFLTERFQRCERCGRRVAVRREDS